MKVPWKKVVKKIIFSAWGLLPFSEKHQKTSQLWTSATIKPLDPHCIVRYPWKDNIQIFHFVPKDVMYVQWFGCKQVLKIMATTRTLPLVRVIRPYPLACPWCTAQPFRWPQNLISRTEVIKDSDLHYWDSCNSRIEAFKAKEYATLKSKRG